ncbi:MAG: lysophospholipid acyltransferase family protein [Anaerolineae bacterium]
MLREIWRFLIKFLLLAVSKLLFKLTISGRENLPKGGPLIIIGNHFSWYEAPLIGLYLPYRVAFFAAAELQESRFIRLLSYAVEMIPVHRGTPDRVALRRAQQWLEGGGVLLIMPEGGIDPELQATLSQGETVGLMVGQNSRLSGHLIPPRPGAAFLAVRTGAPILPVAFLGTELAQQNIQRRRRTAVSMRIGPVFGPLTVADGLHGRARRQQLDEFGHEMMRRLARLLPPENRGPYA